MKAFQKTKKMMVGLLACLAAMYSAEEAQATVAKENRVLVVISELDSRSAPELRPLYTALEGLTQATTQGILQNSYRSIHFLKNSQATPQAMGTMLRTLARNPSILAIDTILSVHGSPGVLHFADGAHSMAAVERAIVPAGMSATDRAALKRKLRVMYNLSCYGRSHNRTFSDLGFDIVAGSNLINANSQVEFVPVLTNWAAGGKFVDGFIPSNTAAALAMADAPIRLAGQLGGNSLVDTDSKKFFIGQSAVRINSDARP
ncbi:MAG: hypothetical protein U1E10_16315 [Bdellovibrionales bacterium]|nr:hypothetical protein [Bdellovibrionales bacterium]